MFCWRIVIWILLSYFEALNATHLLQTIHNHEDHHNLSFILNSSSKQQCKKLDLDHSEINQAISVSLDENTPPTTILYALHDGDMYCFQFPQNSNLLTSFNCQIILRPTTFQQQENELIYSSKLLTKLLLSLPSLIFCVENRPHSSGSAQDEPFDEHKVLLSFGFSSSSNHLQSIIPVEAQIHTHEDTNDLSNNRFFHPSLPLQPSQSKMVVSAIHEVYVTNDIDSPSNSTNCDPSFLQSSSLCNLRSAISYCTSLFSTSQLIECLVYLPTKTTTFTSTLEMDSQYGQLLIEDTNGILQIIGEGNLIIPIDIHNSSSRFLYVHVNASYTFHLKITNASFAYFGDSSISGGVLLLLSLSYLELSHISFLNNKGVNGAAILLDDCSNVTISHSHFQNNLVQSHGGGINVIGTFSDYLIEDCQFDSNIAQFGNGGGVYLNGFGRNVTFLSNNFTSNQAILGVGGGLYGGGLNVNTIYENLYFFNNTGYQQAGGLYIGQSNTLISIISSIFRENHALYGGGMYVSYGTRFVEIISSEFLSNTATMNGGGVGFGSTNENSFIVDCLFISNEAGEYGGAMDWFELNQEISLLRVTCISNVAHISGGCMSLKELNTDFDVNNCTFLSNSAITYGGGGISLETSQDRITVRNSHFEKNFGEVTTGSINLGKNNLHVYLINNTFFHEYGYFGGSVSLSESNQYIELQNCTFYNCTSKLSGGSLYFGELNFRILINQCQFDSNTAVYGGSISIIQSNQEITITNSTFLNNYANRGYGGSIYIKEGNSEITITRSYFQNNVATFFGGAICSFISNLNIQILDSQFISNSATSGGAINFHIGNFGLTISKNIFTANTVLNLGGACYINYRVVEFEFRANLFEENKAGSGGAMAFDSQNNYGLLLLNIYKNNYATANGGGLYLKDSNAGIVLYQNVFLDNLSIGYGGGISLLSSNPGIQIWNCFFNGNSASIAGGGIHSAILNSELLISSSIFRNSYGVYGGGIFIGEDHDEITISNNEISGSLSDYGGGIYLTQFTQIILIESCQITGNIALIEGGAIHSSSNFLTILTTSFLMNYSPAVGGLYLTGSNIIVTSCTFLENSAVQYAGGIMLSSSHTVTFNSCIFYKNSGLSGGALWIEISDAITFTNCTFDSNYVSSIGGAINMFFVSLLHISQTSFHSNYAIDGGGAIAAEDDIWSTYRKIQFINNSAALGGAIQTRNSQIMSVEDSYFYNNTAEIYSGSALWLTISVVQLINNTFQSNLALQGGGTVYWEYFSGMLEPYYIVNNTYINNTAIYGENWATEGMKLYLPDGNQYNVTEYNGFIPVITVQLYDLYDQYVNLPRSNWLSQVSILPSYLNPQLCYDGTGYVTGGYVQSMVNGQVNFSSLEAYCSPNNQIGLNITTTTLTTTTLHELYSTFYLTFRNCNIGEYYENKVCKLCPNGTYSLKDNTQLDVTSCQRCPTSASSCYGKEIKIKEGYWRIHSESKTILSCPHESCIGGWGVGDELCKEGYEGPLCSVCSHGYYYHSNTFTCYKCHENQQHAWLNISSLIFLLLLLLFLLLLVGIFYLYQFNKKMKYQTSNNSFDLLIYITQYLNIPSSLTQSQLIHLLKYYQHLIQSRFKIYIVFYQIISSLPFVLDVNYPLVYNAIISPIHFFNLRLSDTSMTSCSMRYDYIDLLIIDTLYPVGASILLFFIYLIHILYLKYLSKSKSSPQQYHAISSFYLTLYIMFLYLCLPGISTSIFRTYPCQDVDPDDVMTSESSHRYMRSDYSISCSSNRYFFGVFWATIMIIIYPIGVPLVFLLLLYRHKQVISTRSVGGTYLLNESYSDWNSSSLSSLSSLSSSFASLSSPSSSTSSNISTADSSKEILRPLRVLYASYLPNYWYWEIIETYFRLLLTGFLVLVSQGSSIQIIVGIICTLFFLQLYHSYQPYLNKSHEYLKILTIWQVYFMLFLSLLLRNNLINSNDNNWEVSLVTVVIIFFSIIYDFLRSLSQYLYRHYSGFWALSCLTKNSKKIQMENKIKLIIKEKNNVNIEIKKIQEKLTMLETVARGMNTQLQELTEDYQQLEMAGGGGGDGGGDGGGGGGENETRIKVLRGQSSSIPPFAITNPIREI